MYILGEYYSDLALNMICFCHFITMSQSTKRRWNSGPSTPFSTSKKKKYNCKFQDEWKKSHHWLQSSSLGNDLAFCTLCSSNFSVASGGLYDICCLICAKQNQDKACFEFNPSDSVLRAANECVFIYHFTSLLYYHSTTRYNFGHLKATRKISPLEELVGGDLPLAVPRG